MPTERQLENWKRIVETGKKTYITKQFISFGLNMLIFVFVFEYLTTKPINFTDIFNPPTIIRAIISGAIGGLVYAFGSWYIGNWRFGKYIK